MRVVIDSDRTPGLTATYLRIAQGECAFIEAHTSHAAPRMLQALAARGRVPEEVRYLIVTHAHLDHAAGASALLQACPKATLLAHPRAAKNLIDPANLVASATHVYGAEKFAELYGHIEPVPAQRVRALADGETFELGNDTLRAVHTAGHAWHHLVIDDPAESAVFTGDSFGLVYPALQRAGTFALATTSPTGFHAAEARKSIERILALGERTACLTHFGEVTDLEAIAQQLRGWIDFSEACVGAPREIIEEKLRAAIAEQARARGLQLTQADWDLLGTDIDLNAQGLATARR